ncbi:MAG: septum formation initiator family protein [Pseudomonadales bacterium]
MKWLWIGLAILLVALQVRLWIGEGSLAQVAALQTSIATQQEKNNKLEQRNELLTQEVRELQTGTDGAEEKARSEMGMIRDGETFFMHVPE